ncbi:PadR family transcriptional regulator [Salibaculum griseiflavum]|uniref:Transcription regulator PadR N-terminal domain-containing protein n=1 Tax=Salibaculum griseiflavum TaxID=1914409 RepID=A0A2V1P7J3_9RHOB|nr:PadR family transcriptional regulator [Salibaculum griseiflavum]PWG18459.1 hypothetical protein DFK10_00590 [Salibaculum griseiflavum]
MTLAKARELAVLSVLSAHPAHGYDISRAVASGPLSLLGLSRPAVYAILDRFTARGWVTGDAQPSGNRPEKTVMHLTDAGRAALNEALGDAGKLAPPVIPLMAILLAQDAGNAVPEHALTAVLDDRRKTLAELEADTDHAATATTRLAQRLLAAEISTLEELLQPSG